MKKKYYIIQEIGHEYNDSGYDREEGGTPKEVFTDREKAIATLDKLNLDRFNDGDVGQYIGDGYNVSDDIDSFISTYNKIFGAAISLEDIGYDLSFPNMTLEQYKSISPFINVKFYQLIECDGQE